MTIQEIITKHMQRYSVELQQKLEDYKTSIVRGITPEVRVVLRQQVKILEAKMDVLRDLDEDVQKESDGDEQKSPIGCVECGSVYLAPDEDPPRCRSCADGL